MCCLDYTVLRLGCLVGLLGWVCLFVGFRGIWWTVECLVVVCFD